MKINWKFDQICVSLIREIINLSPKGYLYMNLFHEGTNVCIINYNG